MTTNGPEPTPESLWLTAEMRVAPADAGKAPDGTPALPRFHMVAYTGGAMRLEGWKHPVVVDLAGLTIPSQSRPIRVGHNTDRLVGHTHAIAQEDGRLVASGVLSIPGPDTERVVAGSRNGFPWQASIGARVDQYEFVKDGQVAAVNGREFPGPVVVVRKSTLGEISFVDLGADGNTSASVAAKAQESATMTTPSTATGGPDLAAGDPVQSLRTATAAEVKRIAAVRRVFAGTHPEVEAQAIEEGWDETRAELARLRLDRPAAPAVAGTRADDRFPAAQMLEAALALTRPPMQPERHYPADLLQAAEDRYGPGLKIRQVIYFVARANGYTGSPFINKRSFGDAMYYAWTLPMTVRAAGTSTLSLPAILSNLANKELLDAYREEDQTWREIAIVRSVSDFKTVTSYRLIGKDQYELVAPGGEIKHGTVAEETYSNRADTYGLMLSIDRRDGIPKIPFNRGDELPHQQVSLRTRTQLAIRCDGSFGHSHPSSHCSSFEKESVESVYRTLLVVVEPETSTLE